MFKISSWTATIGGILGGTAVLNGLVVYFAVSSSVPRMEDAPYEKGIRYSSEQEQLSVPVRKGWRWELADLPADSGERRIVLKLSDAVGKPLSGGSVLLEIKRYDTAAFDQTARCTEISSGEYELVLSTLKPGLYLFTFRLDFGGTKALIREQELLRSSISKPRTQNPS